MHPHTYKKVNVEDKENVTFQITSPREVNNQIKNPQTGLFQHLSLDTQAVRVDSFLIHKCKVLKDRLLYPR